MARWDFRSRHRVSAPRIDLLPGRIGQNIARFDPAASDADVIAAAQLAGVHDLINALPDGYASQVGGASGTPLSGEQVQRIGLARAVLFCPKLLVLDEPNAHLDGDGDDALNAAILKLRSAGATVIVMAHRPSAISAMNKIMILENGRMVRFDTKEAILGGANVAPMVRTAGPTPTKPNGARPHIHPPQARGGIGSLRSIFARSKKDAPISTSPPSNTFTSCQAARPMRLSAHETGRTS